MRQPSSPFTDHDVHAALRNTGLIASHRLLEARLYAAQAGALVPDCAPPGVAGGVFPHRLPSWAYRWPPWGRKSTEVPTGQPTRLPPLSASHFRRPRSHH